MRLDIDCVFCLQLALVRHLITINPRNVVYALARKPENALQLVELSKSEKNLHIVPCDLDDRTSIKVRQDIPLKLP